MKKAKKFLTTGFIFLFFLFVLPNFVGASNLWEQQQLLDGGVASSFGENKNNPTDFRYKIVKIINQVLGLLGIIVIILIMYAGFSWMTAAGNEDQVSKAKTIMKNAIIGLIVITFAWSISRFVLRRLDPRFIESSIDAPYSW